MTTTIDDMTDLRKKTKATDAVRALAEKHGGTITPEIILKEAKRKTSALHAFFCWDDTAAAIEYRRIQAATLIRRIKVVYHTSDDRYIRVRAFVNVVEPQADYEPEEIEGHGINARQRGIYVGFQDAMQFDSYQKQVLDQCRRDVESFRSKYSAISEASQIIAAMEDFSATLTID
jgi:hypothetical protein